MLDAACSPSWFPAHRLDSSSASRQRTGQRITAAWIPDRLSRRARQKNEILRPKISLMEDQVSKFASCGEVHANWSDPMTVSTVFHFYICGLPLRLRSQFKPLLPLADGGGEQDTGVVTEATTFPVDAVRHRDTTSSVTVYFESKLCLTLTLLPL